MERTRVAGGRRAQSFQRHFASLEFNTPRGGRGEGERGRPTIRAGRADKVDDKKEKKGGKKGKKREKEKRERKKGHPSVCGTFLLPAPPERGKRVFHPRAGALCARCRFQKRDSDPPIIGAMSRSVRLSLSRRTVVPRPLPSIDNIRERYRSMAGRSSRLADEEATIGALNIGDVRAPDDARTTFEIRSPIRPRINRSIVNCKDSRRKQTSRKLACTRSAMGNNNSHHATSLPATSVALPGMRSQTARARGQHPRANPNTLRRAISLRRRCYKISSGTLVTRARLLSRTNLNKPNAISSFRGRSVLNCGGDRSAAASCRGAVNHARDRKNGR